MTKYDLTSKAVEDLINIWTYTITAWSEDQADLYYNKLITSFLHISRHPDSKGKAYDSIYKGLRGWHVGSHVVFFIKQQSGKVLIVRILHERMDYKRHFG